MTAMERISQDYAKKLKKALEHLRYSHDKILRLPTDSSKLNEGQLETWESFSARFSRVVDLFLTKYLRTVVLQNDPGFDGSLRDFVNQAEKIGLIESAQRWMAIRELRNITAYEYADEDLKGYFEQTRKLAGELLRIEKILNKAKTLKRR